MGVGQDALVWLRSYLSGRTQSCFVDGELSTPLKLLECGVPQGSIGGPLLWLCFTCDQPDVVHSHSIDGQDPHRGCQEQHPGTGVQGCHGGEACGELVGYVDDGDGCIEKDEAGMFGEVVASEFRYRG